tara:strand:- start:57 stop:692 length:636 start_codon:yes stop_codon:yes gene_type:complete
MEAETEPKIVVISSPNPKQNEAKYVQDLIEAGLWRFHLRKPSWSSDELRSLLKELPEACLRRVVLHRRRELLAEFPLAGYHLTSTETYPTGACPGTLSRSFHDLECLDTCEEKLDYVFIGPVFDSVSKQGYASAFEPNALRDFFRKRRRNESSRTYTIALGGIVPDRVRVCLGLGFDGVAVLGGIWASRDPAKKLHRYLAAFPWISRRRVG